MRPSPKSYMHLTPSVCSSGFVNVSVFNVWPEALFVLQWGSGTRGGWTPRPGSHRIRSPRPACSTVQGRTGPRVFKALDWERELRKREKATHLLQQQAVCWSLGFPVGGTPGGEGLSSPTSAGEGEGPGQAAALPPCPRTALHPVDPQGQAGSPEASRLCRPPALPHLGSRPSLAPALAGLTPGQCSVRVQEAALGRPQIRSFPGGALSAVTCKLCSKNALGGSPGPLLSREAQALLPDSGGVGGGLCPFPPSLSCFYVLGNGEGGPTTHSWTLSPSPLRPLLLKDENPNTGFIFRVGLKGSGCPGAELAAGLAVPLGVCEAHTLLQLQKASSRAARPYLTAGTSTFSSP
ncbi:hypothetical protein HJG60_009456 [Phyllostomus discolor]|uniref:Uncharacterized protein n=1 Tax=Phyllostomus discolor TaxID=89673 RepID=A0A833YIV5_9CHIR|nr:hypothetical protein HJG60_009456 [Phyllostomus discolor]